VTHLDSALTHSDINVTNTVSAYNIGISYLIKHPGDRIGSYNAMGGFVNSLEDDSKDLKAWWIELENGELPNAKDKIGWIKIAFMYAAYFLKSEEDL